MWNTRQLEIIKGASLVWVLLLAWCLVAQVSNLPATSQGQFEDWEPVWRLTARPITGQIAYSPDGRKLAVSTSDDLATRNGLIEIWDTTTWALEQELPGHEREVTAVSWSPDASRLASGSYSDREVRIWDVQSGAVIRTLPGHYQFSSLAWSADASKIASTSGEGRDAVIKIWDAQTGVLVRTLRDDSRVFSISWSPDSSKLAGGSSSGGGAVKIWDAETGAVIRTIRDVGDTWAVAWSPDSSKIASNSRGFRAIAIKIWDASTGEMVRSLTGHTEVVYSVAWSPDSTKLVSGSKDKTVKIWDIETGGVIRTFTEHTGEVRSVVWSPGSNQVASGSGRTIKVWDVDTGAVVRTLTGHTDGVSSVAWSPGAGKIASGAKDKMVNIWDVQTGAFMRSLTGHGGQVFSVAWSPDARKIASGSEDKTIRIWDAETGAVIRTLTEISPVLSVAWSPDARKIVSGSGGAVSTIRIWDAETGALLRILARESDAVGSVAWSPDSGKLASGSREAIKIWDAQTGTLLKTLTGYSSIGSSLSWSPDASKIAAGSGRAISIWDVETGAVVRTLTGSNEGVGAVSWSPDSGKIASSSERSWFDRTIKIWDVQTGAVVGTLIGHTSPVLSVSWSPDPDKIASSSSDGAVRVWRFRQKLTQSYILPHVASGPSGSLRVKTTFILTNPSDSPAAAYITLTGTGGSPFTLHVELAPGRTRMIPTDRSDYLTTGAAVVCTSASVSVSARFSILSEGRLVSEAGVLDSPALVNFTIPVDHTGNSRTGVALFNPNESTAQLTLRLLDTEGRAVASVSPRLYAKFHEASFIDELFRVPDGFRGSLSIASTGPVSGMALRATGALLATLPVTAEPPRRPPYVLPQVTNGQAGSLAVKTTFMLTNPSSDPAVADITLTRDDGSPFVVAFPEQGTGSTFRIELAPGGTRILPTDGSGLLTSGSAVVNANVPLGVSALFSIFSEGQLISEAGVLDSPGLEELIVPIDNTEGSRVGVALFNPGDSDARLTLRLRDMEGRAVADASRTLNAKSHESKFVDELFAGVPADFRGALSISSTPPISGVALRLTGSLLATLPVTGGISR